MAAVAARPCSLITTSLVIRSMAARHGPYGVRVSSFIVAVSAADATSCPSARDPDGSACLIAGVSTSYAGRRCAGTAKVRARATSRTPRPTTVRGIGRRLGTASIIADGTKGTSVAVGSFRAANACPCGGTTTLVGLAYGSTVGLSPALVLAYAVCTSSRSRRP